MLFPIHVKLKTDSTLTHLQGETNTYHSNYEIIVRKEDQANILSDIIGYKIGIDKVFI